MRILYVNNYQGSDLIKSRHIFRNRGLGGSRKVELVSNALKSKGHEVLVLSAGMPAEGTWKFYKPYESTVSNNEDGGARVFYSSSIDLKYLNFLVSLISSFKFLLKESKLKPFDLILIYDVEEYPFFISWFYHVFIKRIPIVLEYEDSIDITGRGIGFIRRTGWKIMGLWLSGRLKGIIGLSNKLTNSYCKYDNRYTLPGIVSNAFCDLSLKRSLPFSGKMPFLAVFCGSLIRAKGAHYIINVAHKFKGRIRFVISGSGPLLAELSDLAKHSGGDVEIVGCLDRRELDKLLTSADILINPHEEEASGNILPFKLIEYLVGGGVVITTKDSSLTDEVFNYCEFTSPSDSSLADSLEKVLAEREFMVDRTKKGQAWAISKYSESAVAESIHRLVLSAVSV